MDENKDGNQLIPAALDRHIRTSPFGKNRSGERAYRRAERLIAAIYLLTNHIDAREPLRKELREIAPRLLQQVLEFRKEMRSSASPLLEEFRATILRMMSLVKILGVSGYISSQNAEIGIEALDDLGVFVASSQRSEFSEDLRLLREDFSDTNIKQTFLRDIKDRTELKDNLHLSDVSNMSDMKARKTDTSLSHELSSRSSRILQTLQETEDLGIKEVASNLPEYSEKMVQRELAYLVERGVVKKVGSKRWSRYSLVRS